MICPVLVTVFFHFLLQGKQYKKLSKNKFPNEYMTFLVKCDMFKTTDALCAFLLSVGQTKCNTMNKILSTGLTSWSMEVREPLRLATSSNVWWCRSAGRLPFSRILLVEIAYALRWGPKHCWIHGLRRKVYNTTARRPCKSQADFIIHVPLLGDVLHFPLRYKALHD